MSFIQSLHQSSAIIDIVLTGGGSLVLSDLLTVPGASQTLIEANVPYSAEALNRFIGRVPEQYCCPRTARYMAMTAFYRGLRFIQVRNANARNADSKPFNFTAHTNGGIDVSHDNAPLYHQANNTDWMNSGDLEDYRQLIGVACSASLSTDREKKGDLRVYVATQTLRRTIVFSLRLNKGARTRAEEERLVADLILNAIETTRREVESVSVPPRVSNESSESGFCTFGTGTTDDYPLLEVLPLHLKDGEKIEGKQTVGSPPLTDLFFGKTWAVLWQDGEIKHFKLREPILSKDDAPYNLLAEYMQAIFSGSFNPIHAGHLEMIKLAEKKLGSKVSLEISIRNVDKPPLDYMELQYRLEAIQRLCPGLPVWFTQTPLFQEKAELFQETTFVVGADTLRRFADLRFYHESIHQLHDVLRMIAYHDCRFLVFARNDRGNIESLETLQIPDMLRSLSNEIPPSEFAMSISSTELRRREEG